MSNGLVGRYVKHLDFKSTISAALKMASALPRSHRPERRRLRSSEVKKEQSSLSIARMRIFAVHGCKCDACGREGTEIIHTIDNGGGHHVDLYAVENGKYVLMNRDHILPASKGGPNHLWNLRPMCSPCNGKRGNNYTDEDKKVYEFRLRWTRAGKFLFKHAYWLSDRMIYRLSALLAKTSLFS